MNNRNNARVLLAVALLAPIAGCSSKSATEGITTSNLKAGKKTLESVVKDAAPSTSNRPKALSTQEALKFIQDNCSECHAPGKALYAAWGLPEADVLLKDATWLESNALNQTAYQAMVNKLISIEKNIEDTGKPPSPMPPAFKNDDEKKKLGSMIAWFQDSFPGATKEAHVRFGDDAPFRALVKVDLSYKCNKVVTGQEFQARFALRALGSPSYAAESTILSAEEKAAPASAAIRKKVVDGFLGSEQLRARFEEHALGSLARRIANAGDIEAKGATAVPAVAPAARRDLQNEFSQLVRMNYKNVSYPQLFLLNKVMVTSNTAPLYNANGESCATPPAGQWAECTLSPQRSNFFGTRGFLLSKPSSMFENNNNYGRGGDTFSTIFGEVLMANTDGVSGDTPKPIPECLNVTKDKRWKYKVIGQKEGIAAWGAIAIPFYGRVCQGCHLNRHLAAASVVFRPFGLAGEIITPDAVTDAAGTRAPQAPYNAVIQLANTPENQKFHVYHTDDKASVFRPVDQKFYRDLLEELNNPEATCFPDPRDPQNKERAVKANSLAKYAETLIYQNDPPNPKVRGVATVRGLNRFLPSLFLNSSRTNLEAISAVNNAFEENEGKLEPMLRAFFTTETFACSAD
jgi:hypothetical protein